MPIQRDYRKMKNPPRMYSYEILGKLLQQRGEDPHFTARDVSDMFKIPIAEACTRINILKRYNCVKPITPSIYPAVYEITPWGKKYIQKKLKGGK